ncbi:TPA: hypothetical protein ACGBFZ_003550 [Pseudomonas aeruginosa]|nr:hypothetical protein [Pseudomonas aeruginosa]MBG7134472.1 hypothetical protein [Pseudomonas aeruginosa]MBI9213779.1 hypothetical protein [Pseudomonas aeruginosa]HEJ4237541.1 hypothetical protein [Pseudomonas aeruginosa]HEJ5364789.1 hypothetical protein [Pseudomonas aeruginosa]HEK1743760.1 hypothetical protein [Pseudomonas aeruginosa]
MNKANECSCPSGDGSLRHPCPAHPAAEQAGGDERAAFELFVRKHCGMPAHIAVNWDAKFTNDAWAGWQARAALAQPSPALPPFAEKVLAKLRRFYDCASDFESGGVDIGRHWFDLLTQLGLLNRVQRSPALWEISQQGEDLLGMPQPSPAQAEAERPEVVARVVHSNPVVLGQCGPLNANDELMTVAQHAASVARWAEMFNRVEQERDAALARVAELERGKVYVEARQCDECQHGGINDSATGVAACHECDWTGPEPEEDRCPGCQRENCMAAACPQCGARYVLVASEEIAAPVAQAQRSVPEEFSFEYRHPNGECHTVTVSREQVINEMPDFLFEALCSKFCNCEPVGETNVVECCCDEYAEEFKLIASAPGKEGV